MIEHERKTVHLFNWFVVFSFLQIPIAIGSSIELTIK